MLNLSTIAIQVDIKFSYIHFRERNVATCSVFACCKILVFLVNKPFAFVQRLCEWAHGYKKRIGCEKAKGQNRFT